MPGGSHPPPAKKDEAAKTPPHSELAGEASLVALGVIDGLSLAFFFRCLLSRQKVRKSFCYCFAFNFAVAVVTYLAVTGSRAATEWYHGPDPLSWWNTGLLLPVTHSLLLKLPLTLISFPLNGIWLGEMFDEAYLQVFKRRGGEPVTYDQALTRGADAINQGVVLVLVLIQTEVLRVAPSLALWVLGAPAGFGGRAWYVGSWVGFTVAVCYEAWAFSYYAFVARIDEAGNALQRKIAFFESRWMYFLGYGLPPVLLMAYVATYDAFVASILYYVLLPMYAVASVNAQPVKQQGQPPLPVFVVARWGVERLVPWAHGVLR